MGPVNILETVGDNGAGGAESMGQEQQQIYDKLGFVLSDVHVQIWIPVFYKIYRYFTQFACTICCKLCIFVCTLCYVQLSDPGYMKLQH